MKGAVDARYAANGAIGAGLCSSLRRRVASGRPVRRPGGGWDVPVVEAGRRGAVVGMVRVDDDNAARLMVDGEEIGRRLGMMAAEAAVVPEGPLVTPRLRFSCGDGVAGAAKTLKDRTVDLLLTDPPYNISSPHASERQIPRRIRRTGADFIMPRGEFGGWDHGFSTKWTDVVLPKIRGWAVIFCAHAQIKEYGDHLAKHGFVAVGALAWHKTNPVPFNHRFKLLSAFETAVAGKRPGVKFNGKSVHNVFTYKSPSPGERLHPTQKPVALMKELVGLFSQPDGLVFDPFAGSATTLHAAVSQGRRYVGYELDPGHYGRARGAAALLKYAGSGPDFRARQA